MNKCTFFLLSFLFISKVNAQTYDFFNDGGILHVDSGAQLFVDGDFTIDSASSYTNFGEVLVNGTVTINSEMDTSSGTLCFTGDETQHLNGSTPYLADNVVFKTSLGVILNTTLKITGSCSFRDGIISSFDSSYSLWFTPTGSINTNYGPSDQSHVSGYVVKEGTGDFTFPVGDSTRYQAVKINLTTNTEGIKVKYHASDAGVGTFTTTGTDATPLLAYNLNEYWDVQPIGTASGEVTIYWDDYQNYGISNVSDLKVAHNVNGDWLNEGTIGVGSVSSGSVQSNTISTWSPFTLGSTSLLSPLPVEWLSFRASQLDKQTIELNWSTAMEINSQHFEIQRSYDGISFNSIGKKPAAGTSNSILDYLYFDRRFNPHASRLYYRIKQVDFDQTVEYSDIRTINLGQDLVKETVLYPNPNRGDFNILLKKTYNKIDAEVFNSVGSIVSQFHFTDTDKLLISLKEAPGIYFVRLKLDSEETNNELIRFIVL